MEVGAGAGRASGGPAVLGDEAGAGLAPGWGACPWVPPGTVMLLPDSQPETHSVWGPCAAHRA